ncbi:MAG TPA: ShlB/FhaC/HecB family hemolysin secretion/activation protein [Sphingomicrobium sp.]|nr:ShlB/FhaC/HecB family hemolysin secretion/activation protein [Sphingomicrobium sp.]
MKIVRIPGQPRARFNRRGVAHLLASTLCLAAPGPALAQVAPRPLPPTREEVTRPNTPVPNLRGPRLEVEGGVERAPCALDGAQFQSIHFVLRGAEFDGLQGMAADELSSAYAPYVGKDVPISIVCEIRDRAGTILRNSGYIAAVQVPEQQITDGTIHFRVLMAHLTQVRVRGDASGAEKIIASYLNQLTKEPVFNRFEAERYLLLASDLPGYTVRLTLRPAGTNPGDVLGDVTVQHTRAYVDFNVENGGSKELGRWGGLVRGEAFGLTGLGDRTILSVFSTADFHEQQTIQLAHDFRLGPEGLSIGDSFTYAWAKPSVPNSHVLARTLLNTFEVAYPLVRRQAQTVRASAGIDYVNQDVRLDGLKLTRDRLRVGFVKLGFDAQAIDSSGFLITEPRWRFANLLELRQGMHILDATPDCGRLGTHCLGPGEVPPSRLEGQSDATVLRYTGYGEFRPIPKVTLALGARFQYSGKPLLSFEEFSAGNYTVGRGYDPGVLLGDKGFGTQAEIRFGTSTPPSAHKAAIEGYAFWDHASVSNHDKLFVVKQPNHLDSVGGGARVNFDRFALDAALAVPLTRVGIDERKPDPRFLISLTTRLWPWSFR